MRRRVRVVRIMALVLCTGCLLTGCGGFDVQTGKNGGVVSGEAVSGEAVSEDAVDNKKESVPEKKYPYSNDDNFYYVNDNWELLQYKLDGTKVEMSVPKDVSKWLEDILWVDNEWIYYALVKDMDDDGDEYYTELWRVPIEKQKDGDRLLWDKKEKILNRKDFDITMDYFYAWEDFIVYQGVTETKTGDFTNYYKFDLSTKEETPLWKKGKETEFSCCFNLESYVPAAERGISILQETDDDKQEERIALYYFDLKKWEIRKIYGPGKSGNSGEVCKAVADGETIYFVPLPDELDVWRYRKGEEAHCFIEKDDIAQKLEEINPWEISGRKYDWSIVEVYSYKERIYLQIAVNWEQEELAEKGPMEGSEVDVSYSGNLLLSCGTADVSELSYEKEISKCIEGDSKSQKQIFTEWRGCLNYFGAKTGYVAEWMGEDLYIETYDKSEDSLVWGCYNMETGKFKVLSKRDIEIWRPYYAGWTFLDENLLEE